MRDVEMIADQLGILLGRKFRAGVYGELTAGIADGLNEATYPVLSAISRNAAPTSARDLAADTGTDRSVVSRRASTLTNAGLIGTCEGPDARAVYFILTSRGEQAVASMRRRLETVIEEHLRGWSAADVETFARLLGSFTRSPLRTTSTAGGKAPGGADG
jgi:DNA-binding MarR family transcriptional regulator